MRRVFLAFVLVSSSLSVSATADRFCGVRESAAGEMNSQMAVQARLAEQELKVLHELDKMMKAHDWKSGVPVGEQMTAVEADQFGTLRQRQQSLAVAGLHESKRERDVRVIQRMARLADETARYGLEVPKD